MSFDSRLGIFNTLATGASTTFSGNWGGVGKQQEEETNIFAGNMGAKGVSELGGIQGGTPKAEAVQAGAAQNLGLVDRLDRLDTIKSPNMKDGMRAQKLDLFA